MVTGYARFAIVNHDASIECHDGAHHRLWAAASTHKGNRITFFEHVVSQAVASFNHQSSQMSVGVVAMRHFAISCVVKEHCEPSRWALVQDLVPQISQI